MKSIFSLVMLAAAATVQFADAVPIVSSSDLLDSYDYIVVGGGPGGMTVANRLSEDSSSQQSFYFYIQTCKFLSQC